MDIEELKRAVDYNPDTGQLTWLEPRSTNVKAGDVAFNANHGAGYKHGSFNNKRALAHRVAWALQYGEWPRNVIDHINGDKQDNRISNLRDVSQSENMHNVGERVDNCTGARGVSKCTDRDWYDARITVRGKTHCLGRYKTLSEAIAARKDAEMRLL